MPGVCVSRSLQSTRFSLRCGGEDIQVAPVTFFRPIVDGARTYVYTRRAGLNPRACVRTCVSASVWANGMSERYVHLQSCCGLLSDRGYTRAIDSLIHPRDSLVSTRRTPYGSTGSEADGLITSLNSRAVVATSVPIKVSLGFSPKRRTCAWREAGVPCSFQWRVR